MTRDRASTTAVLRRVRAAVVAGCVVCVVVLPGAALLTAAPAVADPYVPSGARITGGDNSGAATPLTPGVHVDTLAAGSADFNDGTVRYYAIAVRRGETPYVSATLAAPATFAANTDLGVSVKISSRGESTFCAQDSGSDYASDDRLDAVTAAVDVGPAGAENGCAAGNLVVRVARTGEAALRTPLPVEIAYRLEPRAVATGLPAASTGAPVLRADLNGTPADVASGHSFGDAPLLGNGIYRDVLGPGDTRIVRVHLDWGQRFAYAFSSSARPGIASADTIAADAVIRNPLREAVRQSAGSSTTAYSVGDQDSGMAGSTLAPVRYLNRRSDDDAVAGYSVAGDYFLVIGSDSAESGKKTLRFPYSLQIEVSGPSERGPRYADAAGSTTGSTPPSAGSDGDGGSTRAVVAAVAGGVAVLGAIVLLVLVVRRRRTGQRRVHT